MIKKTYPKEIATHIKHQILYKVIVHTNNRL